MGREQRRRNRRANAMAARANAADRGEVLQTSVATTDASVPHQVRSDRVIAREVATMVSELKRVVLVSGVCFGMLAVLVVVDRLQ